jgi:hypothetical protein
VHQESYNLNYHEIDAHNNVSDLKNNKDNQPFQSQVYNNYSNTNITIDTKNNIFIYKKDINENKNLIEYIKELENNLNEVKIANSALRQELMEKSSYVESLKKQEIQNLNELEKYQLISISMIDLQTQYDYVKDENIKKKEEIKDLKEKIKKLEDKLFNSNNLAYKRQEILRIFQEEYKILEESINSDWEIKINILEYYNRIYFNDK